MATKNENGLFEVLSPWAEADPVPPKGLAVRVNSLAGKKIGFLRNSKRAARPILTVLENKLKASFASLEVSYFIFLPNDDVAATAELPKFEAWLKEVDAVILAYGD
jgi:hypothetical protein